jgi:hypothetical protein
MAAAEKKEVNECASFVETGKVVTCSHETTSRARCLPLPSWTELRFPPFPHLEQLYPAATPIGDTWTGLPTLSMPTAKSGAGLAGCTCTPPGKDGSPVASHRGAAICRAVLESFTIVIFFLIQGCQVLFYYYSDFRSNDHNNGRL